MLQEYKMLPKNSNTKGKSVILIILSLLFTWLVIHYHLGYMMALVLAIPLFIFLTLIYTEHELSKDD